jgi:hypothetical protein
MGDPVPAATLSRPMSGEGLPRDDRLAAVHGQTVTVTPVPDRDAGHDHPSGVRREAYR